MRRFLSAGNGLSLSKVARHVDASKYISVVNLSLSLFKNFFTGLLLFFKV